MDDLFIVSKDSFIELNSKIDQLLEILQAPQRTEIMYSKDIQKALGCGYNTFLSLRSEMPLLKIGGKYAIRRSDFENWLDSNRINSD